MLFLEPTKLYRAEKQEVPEEPYQVPLGKAKIDRDGKDFTIIAWGAMIADARKAADLCAAEGLGGEIVDLRTLSPLDEETVVASARKTGRVVVLHEAPRMCGLGAEIALLGPRLLRGAWSVSRIARREGIGIMVRLIAETLEQQSCHVAGRYDLRSFGMDLALAHSVAGKLAKATELYGRQPVNRVR